MGEYVFPVATLLSLSRATAVLRLPEEAPYPVATVPSVGLHKDVPLEGGCTGADGPNVNLGGAVAVIEREGWGGMGAVGRPVDTLGQLVFREVIASPIRSGSSFSSAIARGAGTG